MTDLRVMQLLLSPRIGGAERLVATLEEEWMARGVATKTVFLDSSSKTTPLRRLTRLAISLWKFRPQILVAHSAIPNVYARIVPTSAKIVCVLHSASDDMRIKKLKTAEKLLRFRTSATVAVANEQMDVFSSHFRPQAGEIRRVIPNGLSRGWAGKRFISDVPRRVVTVARFAWQKRPDLWVEVAKNAKTRLPGVSFVWWGPLDSSDEKIKSLLEAGLPDNASLAGPTDQPNEVLVEADIMLSTSEREANSIALLEGMASGIVCVASEAIADKKIPWVMTFPANSAQENMLAALEKTIQNWPHYAEAALVGASAIRENHSSSMVAEAYLSLFRELKS